MANEVATTQEVLRERTPLRSLLPKAIAQTMGTLFVILAIPAFSYRNVEDGVWGYVQLVTSPGALLAHTVLAAFFVSVSVYAERHREAWATDDDEALAHLMHAEIERFRGPGSRRRTLTWGVVTAVTLGTLMTALMGYTSDPPTESWIPRFATQFSMAAAIFIPAVELMKRSRLKQLLTK